MGSYPYYVKLCADALVVTLFELGQQFARLCDLPLLSPGLGVVALVVAAEQQDDLGPAAAPCLRDQVARPQEAHCLHRRLPSPLPGTRFLSGIGRPVGHVSLS